jgi:hypothetical protein
VVDDLAMVFAGNSNVYLENINILRNRIYDNGGRQRGRWYSSIPAIWGQLISGEIAGNIIDFSWGNGVNMFWGKGGSGDRHVPFIRGLYHHNKASNTLLGTNDYGGIESWQGGPVFCFNNISHNASGYKHYNNSSIGEAFYFDGSFKHIIFNNIASGVSTERNNTAFMQVLGYYNMYIHNTGYNIDNLFSSGSNNLRSNGHNAYLSNIGDNVNNYFRHSIYEDYVPFEAYAYNVSAGNELKGSIIEKSSQFDLDGFRAQLENYKTRKTQTGYNAAAPVLEDPGSFDFRPRLDGEAIDRGVKFFTPFPLSSVVGEWNFCRHPADSTLIMAENFYMTSEFNDRITYHEIPKNHLTIHSLNDSSFREGILEDWIQGALYFDGSSTYCSLSHSTASANTCNNVDMTDNSFIIEAYIKTTAGHTDGILVSKTDGTNGYELGLNNSGNVAMKVIHGGSIADLTGSLSVNEGNWHHILAEVDRNGAIRLFIDGEEDQGILTGALPDPGTSISNNSDLLIGKNADDQFFNGSIEFLRISKATLADARTTIDELYTWMTEGPFFYDFAGNEPNGKRDAGAIEAGVKNCQLSVSKTLLEFDENSSTAEITILADDGFSLYDVTGEFFTTQLDGNTLSITVDANENFAEREGEVIVYGCNESSRITIQQNGSPCKIDIMIDTIWFDHQESSRKIKVDANAPLTAKRNASFFMVSVIASGDSLEVSVRDNTMGTERVGEITLSACDKTLKIPVIQQGDPNSILEMLPEGMEIYPNPVDDNILYITIPEDIVESEVIISDLRGKQVLNQILNSGHQSLELELGAGIYMIQIKSRDLDVRRKLMIQ